MKTYEIWSEGYACTGDSGEHTFHGKSKGNDFIEAVENFANNNPTFKSYLRIEESGAYYWGCKLFDNAKAASRSFG